MVGGEGVLFVLLAERHPKLGSCSMRLPISAISVEDMAVPE